ncbi:MULTISPECIES: ABC transporter permease [unclassified Sedimentibacter]|uniref:ABC transporter permease n=1 Tax=unclassified Sedimentibacter TaxID=2649220 RepID=UPI0027DF3A08|nr:ABC transporter permease [Sedimentibacter sp. MB35-C1]WMJ77576.1 ABC transporter permease [Sedimentibacter sp. MB35-C1]
MSLTSFMGAIELGLVYSLLAFGTYISFRILNVADLTVDGSFVLGASVSAVFALGGRPVLGLILALLAGAIAGIITAALQTNMGIQPILAGILTMTGLYSVNLMVMGGRANIPLLNKESLFTYAEAVFGSSAYRVLTLILIVFSIFVILNWFFRTQLGLSIRATGDNESMCRASSVNTDFAKMVGFAISNSIVALSGALVAQMQQSADVNMGAGMVVISFASIIIGSVVIKNINITVGFISVIIGSVIYRFIIALILTTNFPPSYLKLISALVVVSALSVPSIKKKMEFRKLRSGRLKC